MDKSLITGMVSLARGLVANWQPTVTHEPFSGYGVDGAPVFYSGTSYTAIIGNQEAKVLLPQGGIELIRETVITIPYPLDVSPKDRITLPSGKQPQIKRVEPPPMDEDGNPYMTTIICDG